MALTIRTRLTIIYTCPAFVLLTLFGVALYVSMVVSLGRAADKQLFNHGQKVTVFLSRMAAQGKISSLSSRLRQLDDLPSAEESLLIRDSVGSYFYRSGVFVDLNADLLHLKDGQIITSNIQSHAFRIYGRSVAVSGQNLWIEVALDSNYYRETLRHLAILLLVGAPLGVFFAGFLGYWFSGQALSRVDSITQTVRNIDSRSLSHRLATSGTDDELERLSITLNMMLDRLQASFSRIAHFTADASHELRTPLALIRGTSEVLRTSPAIAAEAGVEIDSMISEVDRMNSLVSDLLALARADNGRESQHFELINPMELVQRAVVRAEQLATERNLRFTLRPSPAIFPIMGNGLDIERVMIILIDNAMAHTGAGGEVSLAFFSAESEFIFEVADNGRGIAPEHHERIFDRFYRVDNARSREDGGTGLGLALAKSIVDSHGGVITVDSSHGVGSNFRVEIPSKMSHK